MVNVSVHMAGEEGLDAKTEESYVTDKYDLQLMIVADYRRFCATTIQRYWRGHSIRAKLGRHVRVQALVLARECRDMQGCSLDAVHGFCSGRRNERRKQRRRRMVASERTRAASMQPPAASSTRGKPSTASASTATTET